MWQSHAIWRILLMLHMSLNPALRASPDRQHISLYRSFQISLPAEQAARRLMSHPCQRSYGNQLEENWDANSCTCTNCFWMATGLSRKPSRRKHKFSFHLISSSPFGVFLSVCLDGMPNVWRPSRHMKWCHPQELVFTIVLTYWSLWIFWMSP